MHTMTGVGAHTGHMGVSSRTLVACGLISGPLFFGASIIQGLLRPGFDLLKHPISLLSLGELGWIQILNFEVSGLLAITAAVGIRGLLQESVGGTLMPILFSGYGVGLIVAGLGAPDPALGFPAGTSGGIPATMSLHGTIHAAGFFISMVSLIGTCAVVARRYVDTERSGLAVYSVATALAVPTCIVLSSGMPEAPGELLVVLLGVITAWVTIMSASLRAEFHDN